jgi:hypothetical protein
VPDCDFCQAGKPDLQNDRKISMRIAAVVRVAIVFVAAIISLQAVHAQDWVDQRPAGPFHCHADFHLDPYQPLLDELAYLQSDLVHTLSIPPTSESIELYLFASADDYKRYLNSRYPQVPYRRALYIKDRGPGEMFAQVGPNFEIDLRHEATHALLHGCLPVVPLWLDEGLAKYFEMPRDRRVDGNPAMLTVKDYVRRGQLMKLAALEQKRDLREMGIAEYRNSWAWVHFMLNGPPEARDELVGYLRDIREHRPTERLSVRLERRLPGLDERISQYLLSCTNSL